MATEKGSLSYDGSEVEEEALQAIEILLESLTGLMSRKLKSEFLVLIPYKVQ